MVTLTQRGPMEKTLALTPSLSPGERVNHVDCSSGGEIPPHLQRRNRFPLVINIVVPLSLAAALFILYHFNPAHFGFYPRCTFYQTTGLLCPGCGSLRAIHQLLHGQINDAFRLNAMLVLALPLLAFVAGRALYRKMRNQSAGFIVPPAALWAGLVVLVAFGILRNVPLHSVLH